MSAAALKFTAHHYDGEVVEGEYNVIYDGEVIGTVRRGSATQGYYGAWRAVSQGFETRRQAGAAVLARHLAPDQTR